MTPPDGLLLALAGVMLAVSALLGLGEGALRRVSRTEVVEAEAAGKPWASGALTLVDHETGALAGLAVTRLLAEIVVVASLTLLLAGTGLAWWLVVLAVVVLAGLAGLLVRVGPRRTGARHALSVLALTSTLLLAVRPVGRLLPAPEPEAALEDIVELVEESEDFEAAEGELVRSVLELGDTITREVMVPRTEMITVDAETPLRKALALFLRSGFSRVPVIGESVDDLLGVLFLKDVVRRLHTQPGSDDDLARSLMRPAVFVPESKHVDDLLRDMQRGSSHIALVVDEYGGIAGLVTIEDALEEIVGELTDEHDRREAQVEDLGDGVFRVPARLALDELGDLFGIEIDDDDVDSAGGLLAKALGKVPLAGSSATVGPLLLEGERVEGRRKQLATVLVRVAPIEEDE